jgi:hypothetical protein
MTDAARELAVIYERLSTEQDGLLRAVIVRAEAQMVRPCHDLYEGTCHWREPPHRRQAGRRRGSSGRAEAGDLEIFFNRSSWE